METPKTPKILVERLLKYYNPFLNLGINWYRYHDHTWEPVEFRKPYDRDEDWHYGRVAFFVQILEAGRSVEPLEIDMYWHGSSVTGLALLDGHHRLCAAEITKTRTLPAHVGGVVSIIEWLTGVHDRAPNF